MNKRSKIALFSLLALIAAFGLMVAGCENPVQEVEGTVSTKPNRAPAPSNFTVERDTTSGNVTVKFDAVDYASDYYVLIKESGKKLIKNRISGASLGTFLTEDPAGKVTCVVPATNLSGMGLTTGTWDIGIQTASLYTGGSVASDIVWAPPLTIP